MSKFNLQRPYIHGQFTDSSSPDVLRPLTRPMVKFWQRFKSVPKMILTGQLFLHKTVRKSGQL